MTFDQSQRQQMMNISAGFVQAGEDGGYQTASTMDGNTASAQPDQTTSNDNSGNNEDEGCFTCFCASAVVRTVLNCFSFGMLCERRSVRARLF